MITFPNAKINLGLNIIEKRPDGYHNLETVFYPINLQDALEVSILEENNLSCKLSLSGNPIEGDTEDNLIIKAYRLLQKKYDLPAINIHLFKHIPTGAGLGGGSSDGAFMLNLLNKKFHLKLSTAELESYAAQLGADCAFFIQNKPVFATGTGNIFEPITLSLKGYHIILVKPDIFISTKEAFSRISPIRPETSIKEIIRLPIEEWKGILVNDFEQSVFPAHPEIAAIKDKLYDLGAVYSSMSGSGSAVYGLFKSPVENIDEKFSGCFCRQRVLE